MTELKYKILLGYLTILNILQNISLVIPNYMKDKYRRYKIGQKKIKLLHLMLMEYNNGLWGLLIQILIK